MVLSGLKWLRDDTPGIGQRVLELIHWEVRESHSYWRMGGEGEVGARMTIPHKRSAQIFRVWSVVGLGMPKSFQMPLKPNCYISKRVLIQESATVPN